MLLFNNSRLKNLVAFAGAWLILLVNSLAAQVEYVSSTAKPPAIPREFRGAWVATVGNIDWPSKPGLSSEQQKSELLAILDRAVLLRLNAIILQVRPSCDAFYPSRLEPWSEYLTGQMGQPPRPAYDPLAFAVEEAHKRALELHAWFNPYRVRTPGAKSPISPNHVTKRHPEFVKSYGDYLWLDPGDSRVQDYIIQVFLDVVRRYDVDAVHIDDYFYPPQQKNLLGNVLPFPDWGTWKRYQASGGKLARDDWRRDNVDRLVERLYRAIKAEKDFVKFGVSPAGIWRPGNPPQIRGFDPYAQIYANSRNWLANGWLDYLAPQLYWDIQPPAQSYPVLLKWWTEQNAMQRHLWPGNSVSRLGAARPATEIVNQLRLTRNQRGASGNIFWNFKPLLHNKANIVDALRSEVYAEPALVPGSPWLSKAELPRPVLVAASEQDACNFAFQSGGPQGPWLWVLQTKTGPEWKTEILPAQQTSHSFQSSVAPRLIALTAVDRFGNASSPCVLQQQVSGQ